MSGVKDWGHSPRACRIGQWVRRLFLVVVVVAFIFMVRVIFLADTPSPSPVVNSSSSAEPAGDFETFLAALADKESGGDPNAVCNLPCGCVGLYQITKQYVDDLNRIGFYGLSFTYDDRLDPLRAETMVVFYMLHYVCNRLVDYDWSTLARVHHGGPDGWDEEYTKGFGEDVAERMRTTD